MFSGIVQSLQPIIALSKNQGNLLVQIKKPRFFKLKVGDSICVNGVCSTTVKCAKKYFSVEYMPETLAKTNFKKIAVGHFVNLEPSLKLGNSINGHFVSGHVDCTGFIKNIKLQKKSCIFIIQYPRKFGKLLIEKGSMAVNGISLTIFDVKGDIFSVALIPHTLKNTNLRYFKKGDSVNLEFDLIGKYVEKNLHC